MASSKTQRHDPAVGLWAKWHRARHASSVLCRVQQRLETRIVSNTAIQVLTEGDPVVGCARMMPSEEIRRFAVAREAEVLAMTQMLKLQDMLPEVEALSLAGIVAKLDMIVGADRDIGDPTDFPWPHIASALRDLKAIAGDMPAYRPRRSTTRVDVAVHWEGAARLIACLEADEAAARSERTTRPI